MAVQWQPYVWPVLAPWEDDSEGTTTWPDLGWSYDPNDLAKLLSDIVIPVLWQIAPQTMLDYGPGTLPDADIIGEPDGNTNPPIVGGVQDGQIGGVPDHPLQAGPRPTWRVITARIAGDVDVQMMGTTSGYVPGAIKRGVTVPDECGTPYVGDIGTVWTLPNGTNIFLPVAPTPTQMAYEVALGSTGETEAADTDTWEIYNDGLADTGLAYTKLVRIAYSDTGDQTLYAYYRTERYTPRGKLLSVSAETRVTIDVPEACA